MPSQLLTINADRLREDISKLAQIGRDKDHGLYRMAFSEGDMQGRHWFQSQVNKAGLDFYEDGAANLHARLNWNANKPSVITGSHLDTIPGAGHLDGALGVLAGLECLRRIKEENLSLSLPMEVIAFTDEEGRFGGMFGSQAICGQLTPEKIYNAVDLEGNSIVEAMGRYGYDPNAALMARRSPKSIQAFVEMHIEQGPVLDSNKISIGIVDGIVGLFKWNVTLKGSANHAGTTPMNMRQDALQGLAEVAGQINRVLAEYGSPRSVATIGRVDLSPGAANVVPGQVDFSLEVRDVSAETLEMLADAFRRSISAIARKQNLMFEFEVLSEISPVKCDPGIIETISGVVSDFEYESMTLPSGAAHDTQIMASITRAGMVFVPSMGGKSHSPAEWTQWEDIERGANVLLNTLYRLAK